VLSRIAYAFGVEDIRCGDVFVVVDCSFVEIVVVVSSFPISVSPFQIFFFRSSILFIFITILILLMLPLILFTFFHFSNTEN
jgi:hypothetical protein